MSYVYPTGRPLRAQLAQPPVDLLVHVERGLAASCAALVGRYDELADLLAQCRVGAARRRRQSRQLRLDVQRRLTARPAAVGLRLDHLAQLGVGLGVPGGAAGSRPGAQVRLVEREAGTADTAIEGACADVAQACDD